jgi:hypothetical protein|tara:strand:- start:434 stop:910 length:477 start_codon:yes stop_codon:yes gene_type:complete
MKVTNKTKKSLMISVIILFAIIILYQIYNPKIVKVNETIEVPVPVEVPVQIPVEKEYRSPPIKKYKPGHVQQMGVLIGDDEETLPLYGKEVRGRRDRYHYYTTTPGDQIYPLPVTHNDRDCMDDIGCPELYGNENISVLGQNGNFQTKMYRTDNFFNY